MNSKKEMIVLGSIILLFLIILAFPFIYARFSSGPDYVFSGLLFNPLDGNSYLAKMRQGYDGAWTFVLPYTPDPGEGVPINLFYLILGHLARWTGWSLIFTFHFARLMGSGLLFLAIFRLCSQLFKDRLARWAAFILASLGSGLGWMALPFNIFAPDLWLSEAYPFLSSLTNAHFPLGLALQITLISSLAVNGKGQRELPTWLYFFGGFFLAIIYPFGLILLGVIIILQWIIQFFQNRMISVGWKEAMATISAGGLLLLIQYWLVRSHPILDQWNSQNLTPSPDIFILILAFSPAFIIMLLFIPKYRKSDDQKIFIPLLLWLVAAFFLAYLPSNLQRRLLSGIYIPIALLAVSAIIIFLKESKKKRLVIFALILFSVPSQMLLMISAMGAIQNREPSIYLSKGEIRAMQWLDLQADNKSLVAASPDSGLFLPIYAGVQVFYGHPFESIDAQNWDQKLVSLFGGEIHAAEFFDEQSVDFVFYGPREKILGQLQGLNGWQAIYDEGGIQILEKIN